MKRPQDIPYLVDILAWLAWLAAMLTALASAADRFAPPRRQYTAPTSPPNPQPSGSAYADAMNIESDPDMAEQVIGDPMIVLTGEAARVHGEEHERQGGGSMRLEAAAAAAAAASKPTPYQHPNKAAPRKAGGR